MEIIVRGRHTDVDDRFRHQAGAKVSKKIEKLDPRAIRVDVEVSQERNPRQSARRERVELTIRTRGPVIRAEAAADDRYSALDLAIGKLESRLRRMRDRRKIHHGNHGHARLTAALAAPAAEPEVPEEGPAAADRERGADVVPIPMEGAGPLVLREKAHRARPMTVEQALFEMELVGHDFYLFRDKECGHASVVYRRRGWDYGVIRLIEE